MEKFAEAAVEVTLGWPPSREARMTDELERAGVPHPTLRPLVRALLTGLGASGSEVARYLAEREVAGTAGDRNHCAVARFLSAVVGAEPGVRSVQVFRRLAVLNLERRWPWTFVVLPKPVRRFVAAFDAGCFPELVATVTAAGGGTGRPETTGLSTSTDRPA
jgi:hypothetical protein